MSKRWREELNEKNLLSTCRKAKQEQKLTPQCTMCPQPLEVTPGRLTSVKASSWKRPGEVERTRMICFLINFRNKGWRGTIWLWNWKHCYFRKLQKKQILQLGSINIKTFWSMEGRNIPSSSVTPHLTDYDSQSANMCRPIWQNMFHKCKESTPTQWPHRPTPQEVRDQSKVQLAANKEHKKSS